MLALNAALLEGLAKVRGVTLVTPADPRLSAGITVVRFANADTRKVYEEIYTKHRIGAAPTGGLRLSPHLYNTLEDVERAVRAVAAAL
jgi:selenocysteine lyase/cysteine desulfurase